MDKKPENKGAGYRNAGTRGNGGTQGGKRASRPFDDKKGKPAGAGKFSKPAGKPYIKREDSGAPEAEGNRPYAKPAAKGGFGKPAGKPFGKPSAKPFARGTTKSGFGERKPMRKPAARPAEKKPDPALPSTNSRKVALEIFRDVIHKEAYAALSLDDRLSTANLTQLDKRFCASIVYRTLENLIRIDYALQFFLKDAEGLDATVRDILRISACQLLFHDRIPDNAVVDEAVKLTRSAGLEGLTALTNAVLRNMVRGRDEIKWPKPEEGARYLSVMYSVPEWLAEKLLDAYGPEMAKDICAYRTQSHFTTIRPNMMKLSDAQLEALMEKKVWEVEKGAVPHAYRVRMASEIARDADYLAGNFSIQGESSMLAAQAVDVKHGMQVLDCCAAPGGKTAYLAEMMDGTGRVYAWDVHEHRVTLIRAMMKRLYIENVRPIVRDACVLKEDLLSSMDAVLLDAPCSGLGVMDNKPDIKQRATKEGTEALVQVQEKLLDTCCQYVKRNGTLVYSTCSILPEENALQIRRFLEKHPEFVLAPLPASFDERFRDRYAEYGLQLLPHRDGVEGFFIARMRRVK